MYHFLLFKYYNHLLKYVTKTEWLGNRRGRDWYTAPELAIIHFWLGSFIRNQANPSMRYKLWDCKFLPSSQFWSKSTKTSVENFELGYRPEYTPEDQCATGALLVVGVPIFSVQMKQLTSDLAYIHVIMVLF